MSQQGDPEEVRFERMVPDQVVARRSACPVAYLPVGALEWHGLHLPLGTDYLTVQHIAERAAREVGGVAFPPLYYGDVRYNLMDSAPEWREEYRREMQLREELAAAFAQEVVKEPDSDWARAHPAAHGERGPLPSTPTEQHDFFVTLIAKTMLEIHVYGFDVIVLLPGHGPNRWLCDEAIRKYTDAVHARPDLQPAASAAWFDYIKAGEETEPLLGKHWIHADKWEGSIVAAAAPDTVHLDRLPDDPKTIPPAYLGMPYLNPQTGYQEEYRQLWDNFDALDPRRGTDAEYGRRQLDHIIARLGEKVQQLLSALRERPDGGHPCDA